MLNLYLGLTGVILLALAKYFNLFPIWFRPQGITKRVLIPGLFKGRSEDRRHQMIRELDGDLITGCSTIQRIRNKALRVVYFEHPLGNTAPLLVFIHGLGGQISQWRFQIEYFSNSCNILAVDLLGHGMSGVSSS